MSDPVDLVERAATIVAHDDRQFGDAVVPPIFQTSLFTFSDYDDMIASYRGEKVRPIYTRGLNPTVRMFEEMLATHKDHHWFFPFYQNHEERPHIRQFHFRSNH